MAGWKERNRRGKRGKEATFGCWFEKKNGGRRAENKETAEEFSSVDLVAVKGFLWVEWTWLLGEEN